ncbi:hypothetical protein IH601_03085 [Candidatus Bipolaricaulota bacterium]|nr:hypothetical protein [Candidatus Bipolaricaulota bacterium]TFH11324.1 MAG: hypothetical protein E4H08_01675 [Candidatus Atribacteria bacterium]
MNGRPVRTALVAVCTVLLCGLSAAAGGVTFGFPLFTLDVSTTLTQLPVAVENALDVLEATAIGLGMSGAGLDELRAQFVDAVAGIEDFTASFPAWLPIPLIGGGIEFGLPLLIIDGVRFSGGFLSDELVRSIADVAGVEIPQPLVDLDLELGEESGNVLADLEFSMWALTTEVVKQLDLFLLALNLGVGIDLFGGAIEPQISYDIPAEMAGGMASALDALHLDELSWSSFAFHGMIGLELGPPFLRIYGDIRWMVSLSESEGWWGLRPGPLAALLGFVIRF